MAIITKIREKSGLAIGLVAVGLLLFIVGGDILSSNSRLLGKQKRTVGNIAGNEILVEMYQQKVDESRRDFVLNNQGESPNEQQMQRIRNQAWEELIYEMVHKKQYEELGITVTEEELIDMVQGKNIHPSIKQIPMFKNPQTNQFDRKRVIRFLKNYERLDREQKAAWNNFEARLPDIRLTAKYSNLISKTSYVTKAEAKKWFSSDKLKADIEYLYVPYSSVADSAVQVSDNELRKYIKDNKAKFETDANVKLDYVAFPIIPSKEDTAFYRDKIKSLKPDFRNTEDDSSFVALNGDQPEPPAYVKPHNLPDILVNKVKDIEEDSVYGPFIDNNFFKLFKILDKKESDEASVRASHILIKWDSESEEDKQAARKKAEKILKEIRQGADFAALARVHGQDATAKKGGDLGWFGKGRMVKPFEEAVFNYQGTGLIPGLIETKFGYHIIKVTEPKSKVEYKLAILKRQILAGDKTRNKVYRKADVFAGKSNSPDIFYKQISENDKLEKRSDEQVGKEDRKLKGLDEEARRVIQWAYKDTEVGDVSRVFELQEYFVIALLKSKREKGTAPLEAVRKQVTNEVIKQKKADRIIADLGSVSDDFKAAKQNYPNAGDVKIGKQKGVSLSTNSIPNIGRDPVIIGRALGLNENEIDGPFAGETGVAALKLLNRQEPGTFTDSSRYANKVKINYSVNVDQAIKDLVEIEDKRYKHF